MLKIFITGGHVMTRRRTKNRETVLKEGFVLAPQRGGRNNTGMRDRCMLPFIRARGNTGKIAVQRVVVIEEKEERARNYIANTRKSAGNHGTMTISLRVHFNGRRTI